MSFVISLATFKSWGSMGPQNTTGLFVVLYLLNAICIAVYLAMQLLLVANTLDDRWPLGHISFGVLVFIIGQVLLYQFSDVICNNVQHYLDGLFFATFCNLLAVMMIYKVRQCFLLLCLLGVSLMLLSFGIRLPRRIWNSLLVSSRTIGRSRNYCPKRNAGLPCIPTITPSTQAVCPTTVLRTTAIIITERPQLLFFRSILVSTVYVTIDSMISYYFLFHITFCFGIELHNHIKFSTLEPGPFSIGVGFDRVNS